VNLLRRNPELLRHLRSELRAPRMVLAAALANVLCFLISLLHSQMVASRSYSDAWTESNSVFFWILIPQALVLALWCLSSTTQSIASERLLKTYDFLRTTRLTAGELLAGMLFGVPVMAYFSVGCTIPFAIAAGLGSRVPLSAMLVTYFMLFVFVVFLSLVGLLVSMLVQKPRAGGALLFLWFALTPLFGIGMLGHNFPYPGLAALSIVPGLLPLYHASSSVSSTAPFFGAQVPLLFLSLLLYDSFGTWIVVALLRNLKREREEIQLLSRWQAIGLAAYLNLLMLGFLDTSVLQDGARNPYGFTAGQATIFHLVFNNLIFYAVGLATLTPAERLKVWYREYSEGKQSYLSESGLPWPWMAIAAAVAFLALLLETASTGAPALGKWTLGDSALSLFVFLVYATRDVLFLQWCTLTRMKNPILKGILLTWLYYFAAGVLSSTMAAGYRSTTPPGLSLFTPTGALMPGQATTAMFGAGLQIGVILYLLFLIRDRLTRAPAQVATA